MDLDDGGAPHEPTWAMIDIDPGTEATFDDVLVLARLYRTALDHLGVEGRPKVTGKRGIQIWVPVAAGYTFDDTQDWVETVSRPSATPCPSWSAGSGRRPSEAAGPASTTPRTRSTRRSWLPSAPARCPGAPVSVPITWDELDDPDLRPDRWTIRTPPSDWRRRRSPGSAHRRPAAPAQPVTVASEARRKSRTRCVRSVARRLS